MKRIQIDKRVLHFICQSHILTVLTSNNIMLAAEVQYSPIHRGFILQIESASQRPSREFDIHGVRNHYCS